MSGRVLFAFGCLAFYGLLLWLHGMHHVIAQDEAQAWNIARVSNSLSDILLHGEAEGHTPFWHFLLWMAQPFGVDSTSFFCAFLAFIVAVLLMRDAPFDLRICALILFGYFALYEYPGIPRPYILAFFLSAILASLLLNKSRNLFLLSVLLGLIAFTSAFGILLSIPLGILVLAILWEEGWRPSLSLDLVTGLIVYFICLFAAAYFIVFPLDTNEYARVVVSGGRSDGSWWFETVLSSLFPHYRQLPLGLGYWFRDTSIGSVAIHIAAGGVVVSGFYLLRRSVPGMIAMAVALVVIPAGMKFSGTGTTRHLGHFYMALFCIFWATSKRNQHHPQLPANSKTQFAAAVVVCVLIYHSLLGMAGVVKSLRVAQTKGGEIAAYIRENISEPHKLITNNTHDIGHVIAYLDLEVFDTKCNCWRGRADMSLSRKWSVEELEQQWCEQFLKSEVDYALLTPERVPSFDERFELVRQFEKGVRDNAGGPFQLWRLSEVGRQSCKSS